MKTTDKGSLIDRVAAELGEYIAFYDEIAAASEPGWPTFSQSIRIKALLDKQRILVADDTGVNGKTFVGVASKVELDKKYKRNNPALIISPNSGLLNAWSADEINRYAEKLRAPEQTVRTIRHYEDLKGVPNDVDFVVMNWEKLSIEETDERWKDLATLVERVDPQLYVLDECHNGKGSGSLRGKTMRRLAEYTMDAHLLLLSATPIPNRVRDLGALFYLLDPKKYSSPAMFSHCGPEVMKELLDRQVWFRLTRTDLKEELGLPDFHEREIVVNLTEQEAELYFKAWADCVSLGEGLSELRKTLYDPSLSKYAGGQELGLSSKLKKAQELTDELVRGGSKVVIKTNYVTGIIDTVRDAVSKSSKGKARNVLVVSGDTSLPERSRAYLLFRNSSDHNVLVTSPVTEESVDLTTGDVPCAQIALEPEMTPREHTQFTGRSYRRGQRAPVTHYSLITESKALDNLMMGYLQSLVEQYGVKIPKKFRPRTIDSDMLAMRRAKDAIVEKVYGGERLSKAEEKVYDADEVDRAVAHLEGLVSPKTFRSMKPFEVASLVQTRWRNLGEEQFERLVKSKGWRKWKRDYEEGWENSASQATLEIVGTVIDGIESTLKSEPVIVDLGSGAAYLSRATGRQAICVDIDPKFLALGKKICDKRKIDNRYIAAKATDTGLPKHTADIAVNSYMIFYLGQDKARTEVEDAVIETNRITKQDGHFIIALPYTVDDRMLKRFNKNMEPYGFAEKEYLTPEKTKSDRMKKGCHIVVYQKTENVSKPRGLDLSFYDGRVTFVS